MVGCTARPIVPEDRGTAHVTSEPGCTESLHRQGWIPAFHTAASTRLNMHPKLTRVLPRGIGNDAEPDCLKKTKTELARYQCTLPPQGVGRASKTRLDPPTVRASKNPPE